jgi:hypothetical protein
MSSGVEVMSCLTARSHQHKRMRKSVFCKLKNHHYKGRI